MGLFRIALAIGVPVAGFAIGRGFPSPPSKSQSEATVNKVTEAPHGSHLPSLLCEISSGNLARARSRINELRGAPRENREELEKLLSAIAMRDGATFDAILRTFPEDQREGITEACIDQLSDEPAAFVRLLADSEEFSRVAFAASHDMTLISIRRESGLFLDLLEQGKIAWPAETLDLMVHEFRPDPAYALRLLELCRLGQLKVTRDSTLASIIERLDEDGFAKMRSAAAHGPLSALLEQDAKARALFANFDPSGGSWDGISQRRMVSGIDALIANSGVPDIAWGGVPENLQVLLSQTMVRTAVEMQGDAGARTLLGSIKNSNLTESRRNEMLESAASVLFQQQGNIRLAIDFAHAISTDASGRNAGEDLLIKWMTFDPVAAQDFTTKIEPSPYRDRILARVREISP